MSVHVSLYRALLRACGNGRHPEVFGEFGALFSGITQPHHLPNNPAETRKMLRKAFTEAPDHNLLLSSSLAKMMELHEFPDTFQVLRRATALQMCLWPTLSDVLNPRAKSEHPLVTTFKPDWCNPNKPRNLDNLITSVT